MFNPKSFEMDSNRKIIDRKQQTVSIKLEGNETAGTHTKAYEKLDQSFDECVGVRFIEVNSGGAFGYRAALVVDNITKIDSQAIEGLVTDRSVPVSDRAHAMVFKSSGVKVEVPVTLPSSIFSPLEIDVVFDLVKYER